MERRLKSAVAVSNAAVNELGRKDASLRTIELILPCEAGEGGTTCSSRSERRVVEGACVQRAACAEKIRRRRAPPTALRAAPPPRYRGERCGSAPRERDPIHLFPLGRGREPTGPARNGRPDDRLRERVRGSGCLSFRVRYPPHPNPLPNGERERKTPARTIKLIGQPVLPELPSFWCVFPVGLLPAMENCNSAGRPFAAKGRSLNCSRSLA